MAAGVFDAVPCYHPIDAWRDGPGSDIRFNPSGASVAPDLRLPCGQCIGCRLERSRQWAVRIVHEASCWPTNVFVTLTYDEEHVPVSLTYKHVQGFLKRLRSRFSPSIIRFFAVGEYGEQTARPHYHIILFNCFFPDREVYSSGKHKLWYSPTLDNLWGFGRCTFGDVTFESAAYCARYCCDKVTGDLAKDYYSVVDADGVVTKCVPEFAHMSLKPGIGSTWIDRFAAEVYPSDEVIIRGKSCKPPRYYDSRALSATDFCDDVIYQRYLDNVARNVDNSPQRLEVRETVAKARLSLGKRSL